MSKLVYGSEEYKSLKNESLTLFGVVKSEDFNVKSAIRKRIDYLKMFLVNTGLKGFVLGISGGVDSTTTGRLCQIACEELRAEGKGVQFIAVRLPSGIQLDEADAQEAIKFINADKMITINIGDATNLINEQALKEYKEIEKFELAPEKNDFNKGNMKARMRMLAQYQLAGMYSAAVIGTDHNTEGVCGFWTKWGDGSCDLIVLNGLNKTQVRLVAKELKAPEFLYNKVATADLEELAPQKTDESALGIDYSILDKYLEGYNIDKDTEYKIVNQYKNTQHKRKAIVSFS